MKKPYILASNRKKEFSMKKISFIILVLFILSGCLSIQQEKSATIKPFEYTIANNAVLDKGHFFFTRSLNSKDYGYLTVEDPTGSAPSKIVERFEVKPGDCESERYWDTYWSDCDNDRERSELCERGEKNWVGTTWWYSWYMYVPEGYINIYPTKTALGQFHQESGSPVFMFQNHKGGLYLDDLQRNPKYYILIKKKSFKGKWHKFVVNAHWSLNKDGYFKVWVNDELKVDIKNNTMTKAIAYFKYGIYRSFMSRYRKAKGKHDVPGQIVYYADIKKSKTREGLQLEE